jgi:hypothetical protein
VGTSDTLRSVIDAGRSSKRLDELSSARVIGKIAQQIHAAQQKAGAGKAVGPIMPAFVKLSPSGEAKLELGDGNALGYSAPEVAAGGAGDRRSDVFSLGTVLWEALTYQRLFDAMNDAAVKVAVQEREITAPAELNANVPAELSAICMRALSRSPADRYQSLKAMAVEIEEFLQEAGYEDNDTKIASYLATLREPPAQVKITMPPMTRTASSSSPPPAQAAPAATSATEKTGSGTQPPPTVLKQPAPSMLGDAPKQEPRPKSPSGAALAAALANASSSNGLSQAKPASTLVGVPKLDEWQDKAPEPQAATPAAAPPVAAPEAPLPPVLPSVLRNDKATIAAAVPPQVKVATVDAKHVEPKQPAVLVEEKPPALIVEEPAKPVVEAKPEVKPDVAEVKPSAIETMQVPAVVADTKSAPHPVAAVSLGPIPASRESKDVLAGWGWGTDKHNAIAPDGYVSDDDYDIPAPNTKKTLTYVIGGGLALAALVTIIAVGFGGSSKKKTTAAKTEESAAANTAAANVAPTPAPAPAPAPGTEPAAASADLAATGSAQPSAQDTAAAEAAKLEADKAAVAQAEADKAAAARLEADKAAATKLEAEKAAAAQLEAQRAEQQRIADEKKAEQQRIADAKKTEQQRIAAERQTKAEAAKAEAARVAVAKAEAKRAEAARRAEAKKQAAATAKAAPKTTAKTTTAKTTAKTTPKVEKAVAKAEPAGGKADAESAYQAGLRQYARGDMSGALASLRTSLSANPNYPPTWRGLGLVFEKMGERDQARAAYKRYLQLAPGAGDAEQIRGRLDRLGS